MKSSNKRCSRGTRRSSNSWSNWKKQQSYVRLSVQLRRQGGKQRKKAREEAERQRLMEEEKKKKGRMLEYLQQLQDKVLEEEAAILERAEGFKHKEVATRDKEGQWSFKKAKER